MKVTKKLAKVASLLMMVSTLSSCNKEEFYEKDYIQTFKENYDDSIVDQNVGNFDEEEILVHDDESEDQDNSNAIRFSEDFIQTPGEKKVDILWVVDNSGSMWSYQNQLANNFEAFIHSFIDQDINFKMGITTTDTKHTVAGNAVPGSIEELNSVKLSDNKELFLDNFSSMIKVGISGSAREKGVLSSLLYANKNSQMHFRDDAYLVIVYVSDEEDQSQYEPEYYLGELVKFKSHPGMIKTYGIINQGAYIDEVYMENGYVRYKKMSDLTGGYVADINGDFHQTLLDMGEEIVNLSGSFPLRKIPSDTNSIKVKVNNVEQKTGWLYNEVSRTVKFAPGLEPLAGSEINISYEIGL